MYVRVECMYVCTYGMYVWFFWHDMFNRFYHLCSNCTVQTSLHISFTGNLTQACKLGVAIPVWGLTFVGSWKCTILPLLQQMRIQLDIMIAQCFELHF